MSDEYSLHTNFQRFSDDPRAKNEYEYRMDRLGERIVWTCSICGRLEDGTGPCAYTGPPSQRKSIWPMP